LLSIHQISRYTFIFLVLASLCFSSCNNVKYLQKDEALLVQNKVELKNDVKRELRDEILEEAERIARPEPNKKLLSVFRTKLWLWNKVKNGNLTDTSFLERSVLNKIGEPPVLVQTKRIDKSKQKIESYLYNKGYFFAHVDTSVKVKNKRARVNYNIELGRKTVIDSFIVKVEDSSILESIDLKNTFVKEGEYMSKSLFDKETTRMVTRLRKKGYAYFFPNYISYEADTTAANVVVCTIINPPQDSLHRRYNVNNIYVYTNYKIGEQESKLDTLYHEGVYYIKPIDEEFSVKPKILEHLIYLKSGDTFDQLSYDYTNKKFNDFGVYKLADLSFERAALDLLDVRIRLQEDRKMSVGADIDVSSINGGTFGSTIGTSASVNYKNKNLFNGAEKFTFSISNSLEFLTSSNFGANGQNFKSDNLFSSIDFGISSTLSLPGFRFPLHKLDQGTTTFSASFNFFDRATFYTYRTINLSYGYSWYETRSKTKQHSVNLINIDVLRPDVTEQFEEAVLSNNLFLSNSFANQIFIGPTYSYIFQSPLTRKKNSYYLRFNVDVAPVNIGDDDGASRYFRSDIDFRWLKKASEKHALATRFSFGIGTALDEDEQLPYVKQFFVGGPSSIRAFQVRDLGPGGFVDNTNTIQPFQTGNIKLEGSVEYRFDLLKLIYLEGALFADAGNIWTFEDDPDRLCEDGSLCTGFSKDAIDQIAIGGGVGFRFDFSYFIIRMDMAYRLRNPAANASGSHFFYDDRPFQVWQDPIYNLAIGYPF